MIDFKTFTPKEYPLLLAKVWSLSVNDTDSPLIIPPNPYVNLIVPLVNSRYHYGDEIVGTPHLEGITFSNRTLVYPAGTKLVGFRFYAFGSFPFFRITGANLFERLELLHAPELKALQTIADIDKVISGVYMYLQAHYNDQLHLKIQGVQQFYNTYRWNDSLLTIEQFCKESQSNYTRLNRTFSEIVGTTPKKFERLLRFRKALCELVDGDGNLTAVAAKAGYFDQAHFIREFKLYLNQNPLEYLRSLKQKEAERPEINYNFRLL